MNVQTISEPQDSAKAKLKAYRAQLHRRADDEYRAIAQGYAALAKGLPLLDLQAVMRDVECDEKGRPKLAIARADRRQVEFSPIGWSAETDRGRFDARRNNGPSQTLVRPVEFSTRTARRRGYALVPLVPADAIERAGGRVGLRFHYVLWEVAEWADRPLVAQPDRDPYLLRHVGGDLYAVVAEWELTELERAVMAGRRDG